MTCDEYRALTVQLERESIYPDDERLDRLSEHDKHCKPCTEWWMDRRVRQRGYDPEDYPCLHVAFHLAHSCEQHPDPWDCPDALLVYSEVFDEYGIPVRNGEHGQANSKTSIQFCPWCGTPLPPSKRSLWFETLESMGYDDPWDQPIPERFKSSRWWREKN